MSPPRDSITRHQWLEWPSNGRQRKLSIIIINILQHDNAVTGSLLECFAWATKPTSN